MSVLMCFCVFLCVYVYERICKQVHDGSMFTSEWMCNHVDSCELLMCTSISESIHACMCEWWSYTRTWLLQSVFVSLWSGSLCVYVHMFLCVCKWLCEYIHQMMFLCSNENVSISCVFMTMNECILCICVFLHLCFSKCTVSIHTDITTCVYYLKWKFKWF